MYVCMKAADSELQRSHGVCVCVCVLGGWPVWATVLVVLLILLAVVALITVVILLCCLYRRRQQQDAAAISVHIRHDLLEPNDGVLVEI